MTNDVEDPIYVNPVEKGKDDSSFSANGNWANASQESQSPVDPVQRKLKQRHIQM